jgi:hypothetical protein
MGYLSIEKRRKGRRNEKKWGGVISMLSIFDSYFDNIITIIIRILICTIALL